MDIAELEAKKNNIYHLLEFIIKRNDKRFTIQSLVGNIHEHSNLFGPEHWTIEHHGDDDTSIFHSGLTKQITYDGFRDLVKKNKFNTIYYVIDAALKDVNGKDLNSEPIKVHVMKKDDEYTAMCKNIGGFNVKQTNIDEADFSLKMVENFLDELSKIRKVKTLTYSYNSSEIAKVNVFKMNDNTSYQGFIKESAYVPSKSYSTIEELLEKDVVPEILKTNGLQNDKDLKMEEAK